MLRQVTRRGAKRAAQALRGTKDSATRLNEKGEKVRMSKESNVPVMQEVASPKARKAGAKKQNTPAAKAKRKAEGKQAADLMQPAAGSVGKGAEQADAGIRSSKVAAKKANDFDKALALKEKQLADMRAKADGMKDRMNKISYLADNKTKMDALKASIKDMKSRGGPGGRTKIKYKKGGGYMKKKMAGGGSLEMVEKNGKKVPFYAADGVGKMSKGGGVSKAMGEDRTRVPKSLSAKAQSKKPVKKKMGGGQVYERKHGGKTVSGNDGNSIVAACYD